MGRELVDFRMIFVEIVLELVDRRQNCIKSSQELCGFFIVITKVFEFEVSNNIEVLNEMSRKSVTDKSLEEHINL